MANIELIKVGQSANDGTGSNLRAGGTIINENFKAINDELVKKANANEVAKINTPFGAIGGTVMGFNNTSTTHASNALVPGSQITPCMLGVPITAPGTMQAYHYNVVLSGTWRNISVQLGGSGGGAYGSVGMYKREA